MPVDSKANAATTDGVAVRENKMETTTDDLVN